MDLNKKDTNKDQEETSFQKLISENTESKTETPKLSKKYKRVKIPTISKPSHWVLLHDFVPKKDYDKGFNVPDIGRLDHESVKKSWISLLNFLWLDTSYLLEEEEQDIISFGKRVEQLYPNIKIGYITDFNHLIGYLVNRGPVIVDDLLITGVNTAKQKFETTKGPRIFSFVQKALEKGPGISATNS